MKGTLDITIHPGIGNEWVYSWAINLPLDVTVNTRRYYKGKYNAERAGRKWAKKHGIEITRVERSA